jgi:hypothetical protein
MAEPLNKEVLPFDFLAPPLILESYKQVYGIVVTNFLLSRLQMI